MIAVSIVCVLVLFFIGTLPYWLPKTAYLYLTGKEKWKMPDYQYHQM